MKLAPSAQFDLCDDRALDVPTCKVDHQAEPETQLADFNRALLNINAVNDALDETALDVVKPVVIHFDRITPPPTRFAQTREIDQLVQQTERKCAGTNRRITMLVNEVDAQKNPAFSWRRLAAGGLTIYTVPGDHYSYIRDHARDTAERLRNCLEEATRVK